MKRNLGLLSAMLVGASVYAAEAPTASGFVHAQATYVDTDRGGDNGNVNFSVPDGALYLQRAVGDTKVMVDLPFSASTTTGKFEIDAANKGQGYVAGAGMAGISWKLGQWDTPFGYESNDSVNNVFNTGGAVASNNPSVHRGLSLGYSASEMLGVELFVANPTSAFSGAPSSTNNDKVETGLNVAGSMDALKFNLGVLYARRLVKNHYGVYSNVRYTMDAMSLGLELNYVKDKDNIALSTPEKVFGGLHLNYAMSDVMDVGVRAEYAKHKDADIWQFTGGVQNEIEKDFTLKADYTAHRDNNVFVVGAKGGAKNWTHTVALGAVARF
jgi:hypothetical protein